MSRVAVYIPSRHEALIEEVAWDFSNVGGGCTAIPQGFGYWIDGQGKLVKEPVTYLWTHTDLFGQVILEHHLREEYIPKLWAAGEQAVLFEIDGQATCLDQPAVPTLAAS